MLSFTNVSLHYGSFRALDNITLHAGDGELVVLLGANGAGKSSIFHAASALRRVSAGQIRLKDADLTGRRPADIVRAGLIHCPEGRKLFPLMSVQKNLMLGAYTHRADRAGNRTRLDEVYALFPDLIARRNQTAGSLSGGQQQMVAIARALMGRPRVLMLDEPSLGLAPLVVKQVFEVIQRINRAGTTVLLAEQNAHAALKIAHRAYVVEAGRIVLEGTYESLANNEAVRRAYVGG